VSVRWRYDSEVPGRRRLRLAIGSGGDGKTDTSEMHDQVDCTLSPGFSVHEGVCGDVGLEPVGATADRGLSHEFLALPGELGDPRVDFGGNPRAAIASEENIARPRQASRRSLAQCPPLG
jgi:hypothetical protein